MLYHSTSGGPQHVSLFTALTTGVPGDGGLYLPDYIPALPPALFNNIAGMTLQDIAYVVANSFFGNDIDSEVINSIVNRTFDFEIPLVRIEPDHYSLELFHGPTLAFKDVGARFMTNMLSELLKNTSSDTSRITVLAATAGDSGASIANSIAGRSDINAVIFYPKGKISRLQEKQIATYGGNIQAVEIRGSFDDCQSLVKQLLNDNELREQIPLTSANSINIAHLLGQVVTYFHGYARLAAIDERKAAEMVFAIPSGNLGNLTAAVIAKRMGMPVKRFIAATNANDAFMRYISTGKYSPRRQISTVANAMDVSDPYNFVRLSELYGGSFEHLIADISCFTCTDGDILATIRDLYRSTGYLTDPHGAVTYFSMKRGLKPHETGVMLAPAHPAKFKSTIDAVLGQEIELPRTLAGLSVKRLQKVTLPPQLSAVKEFLLIP